MVKLRRFYCGKSYTIIDTVQQRQLVISKIYIEYQQKP